MALDAELILRFHEFQIKFCNTIILKNAGFVWRELGVF